MKKIKNFINTNLKEYLNKYKLTNIMIFIGTILSLFTFFKENINILLVISLNAIQFFTIESHFQDKKKKWIFALIATCISILISVFREKIELSIRFLEIICAYLSGIILLGVYKIIKDTKFSFSEYISRVFDNLFKMGIVYIILQIGLNTLTFIFFHLILESSNKMITVIEKAQIILTGFYLMPMTLLSITKVQKECSKVIKNIVSYVITPLIIISYLIIYAYILKIILKNAIPQNIIFALITSIFCVSYFAWTVCYSVENKTVNKVSKNLPIVFIPLLILQIYSLFLRIIPYGITERRYIGIMILIFEILAITFSLIKNRKYERNIILGAIAIIVISFVLPFINITDLSEFSKNHWVKKEKEQNIAIEQSKDENADKENLNGESETHNFYNATTGEYEKTEYIRFYSNDIENENGMQIPEGCKMIKKGQCYTQGTTTVEEGIEYTKVGIKKEKLLKAITTYNDCNVNLFDYTKKLIGINSDYSTIEKYVKENRIIKTTNSNIDFYITNVNISYVNTEAFENGVSDIPKVKSAIYDGYFLYK